MINLWASWCLPCRAEMPSLQEVYEDYTGKGLVILAVNATNQDTLADVESFINTVGITFPVLLDTQGTASRDYQLSALPTTFFIGRDGIILDVVVGGPMSEALIRKRVDQLLETR
jgi:thiol-disulfide isomerase/thioredoxin